jgi:hypothetical protein
LWILWWTHQWVSCGMQWHCCTSCVFTFAQWHTEREGCLAALEHVSGWGGAWRSLSSGLERCLPELFTKLTSALFSQDQMLFMLRNHPCYTAVGGLTTSNFDVKYATYIDWKPFFTWFRICSSLGWHWPCSLKIGWSFCLDMYHK